MVRPIIWIKPKDQTVALHQPNPILGADDLAITSGVLDSDDALADFATNLRFTFSRNYPQSNAAEAVGAKYKIAAIGLNAATYDFRYQQGTLTVVAA